MFNSLLWLPESEYKMVNPAVIADLNLNQFYESLIALSEDNSDILGRLCMDKETISYRHAIMEDFLTVKGLGDELAAGLDAFAQLSLEFNNSEKYTHNFYYLVDLILIVETSIQSLDKIYEILNYYSYKSEGLKNLYEAVSKEIESKAYKQMKQDLRAIRHAFSKIKSAEIVINMNPGMRPVEAQVTKLLDHPCKYPEAFRNVAGVLKEDGHFLGRQLNQYAPVFKVKDLHYDMVEELEYGLKGYKKEVNDFIETYSKVDPEPFITLLKEVTFYQSSVTLLNQLKKAGLPVTLPHIEPYESKCMILEDLYNLKLSETLNAETIILNHFEFSDRIYILTGANSGGKTTFTQAIGQIQLLAQLGLMVPARKATVSLVSGIYTHFPVIEAKTVEMGRLGKECADFSTIFAKADPYSLVLMNESFASTSHLESLQISQEVVKALKEKGVRSIFNTHLHELYEEVASMNSKENPYIISLRSGSKEHINSYIIEEGSSMGLSYAMEIAQRYGVTYDQLVKRLEVM